jgi:sugar/nucleoside kinase (ribokinase family)
VSTFRPSSVDVVIAGVAVADVIGRPIDLRRPPVQGGLQLLDSVTLTTGGNVSNSGIDLAKMGFRVAAITRIGNDTLGEFVQGQYKRYGLYTEGVVVDRRLQTAATFVAVDRQGERTFLHTRGCLEKFRRRDILQSLPMIRRARVFAFGYLGLLREIEEDLPAICAAVKKQSHAQILVDTGGNPRRSPALMRRLLPFVDYFIPSHDEAAVLTGEHRPEAIVGQLRRWGATGVVGVKLGSDGCYIASPGGAAYVPPVRVRRVVDATGAGDAFVAGFLAATLKGYEPLHAARVANAVAASCVTAVGASTAIRPFTYYV